MKIVLLAAGAAAIALAGAAFAAPTVPGPKQPIPYDQLNAYMKASPKTRAHKDWWSGETANTGTSANTSATASVTPSLPADTSTNSGATSANPPSAGGDSKEAAPQLPNNPPVNTPPGAVNPSSAATPGAPASTTPPK